MSEIDKEGLLPLATIAKIYGVTERSIQLWAQKGWIPKGKNGMYPFIKVVQGVYAAQLEIINKKKGPDGDALIEWQLFDQKEQGWGRMLKNIELEKKLVPLSEIEKKLSVVHVTFRDRLRALIKTVSEPVVKELLRKLTSFFKEEVPANIERDLITETEKSIGTGIDECLQELAACESHLSNPDGDTEEGGPGYDNEDHQTGSASPEAPDIGMG